MYFLPQIFPQTSASTLLHQWSSVGSVGVTGEWLDPTIGSPSFQPLTANEHLKEHKQTHRTSRGLFIFGTPQERMQAHTSH